MEKFDLSKFGNPVKFNGKQFPLTPTGLKGQFRNVALDARLFKFPTDWAVMSVARKDEYITDNNGNGKKTGRNYIRFGLLNGDVARPLIKAGMKLSDVSIIPVRCDCYKNLDVDSFKSGDFVKIVKPLVFPQWVQRGQGGSYQGTRLVVDNIRKENKNA